MCKCGLNTCVLVEKELEGVAGAKELDIAGRPRDHEVVIEIGGDGGGGGGGMMGKEEEEEEEEEERRKKRRRH